MPDQSNWHGAETLTDLGKGPPGVRQRRLSVTVPSTHGVTKRCQCDTPTAGSNHAAAKGNQAKDRRVEGLNTREVVLPTAVQEQNNGLRARAITAETQVGCTEHTRRLFG